MHKGHCNEFLSTPSARRATRALPLSGDAVPVFLSTPSARRATVWEYGDVVANSISIHALREEGDRRAEFVMTAKFLFLSTPSARRATVYADGDMLPDMIFLSTPSARRATLNEGRKIEYELFLSTPSARRATHQAHGHPKRRKNFYPRPPRGGRPGFMVYSLCI